MSDVADPEAIRQSSQTSMAMLLETLTPTERAVFVLREVFDLEYDEIAEAVKKSANAVYRTWSSWAMVAES